ncbi:MAG: TolC family protein [Bernardetiaceae bacterium]|nr:TolC family protein [Bernardetiaceae bacterium]
MRKILLFFSFAFLMQQASWAQEALSLAEAITRTLSNNYGIQIAQREADIATLNNNWGDVGRFPTIELLLGQNNSLTQIINPASFLQGQTLNNDVEPSLMLNWQLFGAGRINIMKKRLEQLQAESQGNAVIVVQNAIETLILGYYRTLFEQEQIRVSEKVLALSADRYNYAKLAHEVGAMSYADVLFEKSSWLNDSLTYIQQKLSFRNTMRDLNEIMGEQNINQSYTLTEKLKAEPQNYDYEALKEKMFAENIDLRTKFISQEVLKNAQDMAKAAVYPTVDFNLSYTNNINRQDLSGAQFASGNPIENPVNLARRSNYFAGFTVRFMLFNGKQLQRQIQRTALQTDIGTQDIDRLKLELARDLANTHDTYEIRIMLYQIAKQSREIAEENIQISEQQFKQGTINSFDFRIVQNNYQNTALAELEAIYNLIESQTALMRLTGEILEP